jgi:hypothetical protein
MILPTLAYERVPRSPSAEGSASARDLVSAGALWCSCAHRLEYRWEGAAEPRVLRSAPLRCGTAGCLACGGKVRGAAVLALGTVEARHLGMLRLTSSEVLRPYDETFDDPGAEGVREWRRRVAAFMRVACRPAEGGPFKAAAVVVEVEPSGTGRRTESCVCRWLDAEEYERALGLWGPCAMCEGTGKGPMGHVHAHVVVAHDERVWYGHGAAPEEHAGMRWAACGMLGRMASKGLGSGNYATIRGGVGGAVAYLRKIASYVGKVAGKERSDGARGWCALWSAWYLGPGFRRVSTHGEAYGVKVGFSAASGDGARVVCAPAGEAKAAAVKGPPAFRVYEYAPGRSGAQSLPPFIGERGAAIEGRPWAISRDGRGSGIMVPSLGQVATPASAPGACVGPFAGRWRHVPVRGASIASAGEGWYRLAVGDRAVWAEAGEPIGRLTLRLAQLRRADVREDLRGWYEAECDSLLCEVVRRTSARATGTSVQVPEQPCESVALIFTPELAGASWGQ